MGGDRDKGGGGDKDRMGDERGGGGRDSGGDERGTDGEGRWEGETEGEMGERKM